MSPDAIFERVFRIDFAQPGFALWKLGTVSSEELRRKMVELTSALAERYQSQFGRHLGYLSMARFNQQVTTKFHLDGAPDEAYLMLGYEPTIVGSELAIADYTRAATDAGVTPREYLDRFNPMFPGHAERLTPFITRIDAFDATVAQILVINNSALPYLPGKRHSLGVMHQASIPVVMPDHPRVINSTMLGIFDAPGEEPVGTDVIDTFMGAMPVAGSTAY